MAGLDMKIPLMKMPDGNAIPTVSMAVRIDTGVISSMTSPYTCFPVYHSYG
jgi:hypothetical protein